MNDADKKEFSAVMVGAGEIYGREVSREMMRLYFTALQGLTIGQAQEAMISHMRDPDAGQYWPKPADLLRQVTGTKASQQQTTDDKAAHAWASIENQIRRVGAYGTLRLDDKQALAAVAALGGWRHLCGQTVEQLVWARKQFIEMYASFERTPLEMLPASLPGIFELAEHKQQAREQLKSLAEMISERAQQGPKLALVVGDK